MWRALLHGGLALISARRCAHCGGEAPEPAAAAALCGACRSRLALPVGGLQGDQPLLWCALAPYGGALRQLLLAQRARPDGGLLEALAAELLLSCGAAVAGSQLLPIPSWKRSANPLPQRLAAALVAQAGARLVLAEGLLRRSRPTAGQHHLNRALRQRNQQGAFCGLPPVGRPRQRPIWLVDDILTTGATAAAAAAALEQVGLPVQGLICLARTPPPGGR